MKMACIPKITAIGLIILIAYQTLIKESFKLRLIIVFLRKMQEIVNFINGYNYEMRRLQKMDKN